MPTLLQLLQEYFENIPQDILDKEYEEIFSKYAYGPTVDEYLLNLQQHNLYPSTQEAKINLPLSPQIINHEGYYNSPQQPAHYIGRYSF